MAEAGKKIEAYTLLNANSINGNTVFIVSHANTTYSVKASVVLGLISSFYMNTAPANSTATGVSGDIRITNTFLYVCVANNAWVRTPLDSW